MQKVLSKLLLLLLFLAPASAQAQDVMDYVGPRGNPLRRMNCPTAGQIRNDAGTCVALATYFSGKTLLHVGSGQTYATIQAALDAAAPGNVVVVHGGTYRQELLVKDSDITLVEYPGDRVVVDGADPISNGWTLHSGSVYKRTITPPYSDINCTWGSPVGTQCGAFYNRPEMLLVDDTLYTYVDGLSQVNAPGTFWVDGVFTNTGTYTTLPTTVYAWFKGNTNPASHSMEWGMRGQLLNFTGNDQRCNGTSLTGVRVIGISFLNGTQNDTQEQTICSSFAGDLYEEIDVKFNNFGGIKLAAGSHTLRGSNVSISGIQGLQGGGDGTVIEYDEFHQNGWRSWLHDVSECGRGLIYGKGSAAIKKTNANLDTLRFNLITNNTRGIWYDVMNKGAWIEGNVILDNELSGIFLETGSGRTVATEYTYDFTIINNVVGRTKAFGDIDPTTCQVTGIRGEGIGFSSSGSHRVINNTIFGNDYEGLTVRVGGVNRCPDHAGNKSWCQDYNSIYNNLIYDNNKALLGSIEEVVIANTHNSLDGNLYWDRTGPPGNTWQYNSANNLATSNLTTWKNTLTSFQAAGFATGVSDKLFAPGPGLVEDYASGSGWKLVRNSPAIDGSVSLPDSISATGFIDHDIFGTARVLGSVDVGAFEYIPTAWTSRSLGSAAGSAVLKPNGYAVSGGGLGFRGSSDAGFGIFQTLSGSSFSWVVDSLSTTSANSQFASGLGCVRATSLDNAVSLCLGLLYDQEVGQPGSQGKRLVRLMARTSVGGVMATQGAWPTSTFIVTLPTRFRLLNNGDGTWTAAVDDDLNGTYERTLGTVTINLGGAPEAGVAATARSASGSTTVYFSGLPN